jgi:hypothetical protein
MLQVKAWESFIFLKRVAVREGTVVSAARQKVSWNGAINPGANPEDSSLPNHSIFCGESSP